MSETTRGLRCIGETEGMEGFVRKTKAIKSYFCFLVMDAQTPALLEDEVQQGADR